MVLEELVNGVKYSAAIVLASAMLNFGQSVPVTGRVVDNGVPKPGFDVRVYTSESGVNPRMDKGITASNGRFKVLSGPTGVLDDGIIPSDYALSNPFPNPSAGVFNVNFSVPSHSEVGLKVYTILGEECFSDNYSVDAGVWATGFDIHDLASGVYIVRLTADKKLIGSKKLVVDKSFNDGNLLSLNKISGFNGFYKPENIRFIDSVVASGPGYKSSVLRNVGPLVPDSVDVGDISMFTGLANANVFVYDLKYFREKELHPIVGAVVRLGLDSIVTDASGRGTFIVPATNIPYNVRITHPSMRERETKVVVDGDKNLEFDILTFESYPDSIYNFIQKNFGVFGGRVPSLPFANAHWVKRPIDFIFRTDTSLAAPNDSIASWMQLINFNLMKINNYMISASENPRNPPGFLKDYKWKIDKDSEFFSFIRGPPIIGENTGHFLVEWDDSIRIKFGILAGTGVVVGADTGTSDFGMIYAASTVYDSFKHWPLGLPVWQYIDRMTIHELDTGIYRSGRDTSIQSVSNRGPPYEFRNYTANDLLIRPYLLSRPPGTKAPDKDNGWGQFEKSLNKPSHLMVMYSFTMNDGRVIKYQEMVDSNYKGMTDAKIREIIASH